MDADENTLFDLIGTLDDQRRALDAAALWPDDPDRTARRRRQSRAQAMTVARITHELARKERCHATWSSRDIEGYVDRLIDACVDDGGDPNGRDALVPAAPAPAAPAPKGPPPPRQHPERRQSTLPERVIAGIPESRSRSEPPGSKQRIRGRPNACRTRRR